MHLSIASPDVTSPDSTVSSSGVTKSHCSLPIPFHCAAPRRATAGPSRSKWTPLTRRPPTCALWGGGNCCCCLQTAVCCRCPLPKPRGFLVCSPFRQAACAHSPLARGLPPVAPAGAPQRRLRLRYPLPRHRRRCANPPSRSPPLPLPAARCLRLAARCALSRRGSATHGRSPSSSPERARPVLL